MNPKRLILPLIALIAVLAALVLFLNKAMSVGAAKPQEPALPLPYHVEDVVFTNDKAGITLAGTLTLPAQNGTFPAVILISGSGPQNRDEELAGHRPFLVLSDHLTRNGIAVLRYDDRGVGKSTGDFKAAILDDFASDVRSALRYLRSREEINQNKIGLIGHSEGGIIAPMVATSDEVDFIVLLAGPGIKTIDLLPMQHELIARSAGATQEDAAIVRQVSSELFKIVLAYDNSDLLDAKITEYVNLHWEKIKMPGMPSDMTKERFISMNQKVLSTPWFKQVLRYDPAPVLERVECPVLALNGMNDVQVPSKENLAAIGNALAQGGNTNVTVKELPGLNHLFQECDTGALTEYAKIQQTFSPVALREISEWVVETSGR